MQPVCPLVTRGALAQTGGSKYYPLVAYRGVLLTTPGVCVTGGAMPLYDFVCRGCGALRSDVLLSTSSSTGPECCGTSMERQACAPSFHVKGYAAKNLYAGGQRKEYADKRFPNMKIQTNTY